MGTRMSPLTKSVNKQLLPIYDKPLIYYPLSILMLAGIKDILIIVNKGQVNQFRKLLSNGKNLGINLSYAEQKKPNGIAEAFILAKDFIKDSPSCLILGDNIYHGNNLSNILKEADEDKENSTIFTYQVKDPERFGVLNLDKKGIPAKIVEKPKAPKSNLAITGLYFFPKDVVFRAKNLKPSKRGELEITDLNQSYLIDKKLKVKILNRGFTWMDTGTFDSLLEASNFISLVQNRQNTIVACPEEIAYGNKWINKSDVKRVAKLMQSAYGQYLKSFIK